MGCTEASNVKGYMYIHTHTRTVHSACVVIEFISQVFRLMIDLQLQGLIKRKICNGVCEQRMCKFMYVGKIEQF